MYLLALLSVLIALIRLLRQHQDWECPKCKANLRFVWILIADFTLHLFWSFNDILLFFVEDNEIRYFITIAYLFLKELLPIMYGLGLVLLDPNLRKSVLKPFLPKESNALFQISSHH